MAPAKMRATRTGARENGVRRRARLSSRQPSRSRSRGGMRVYATTAARSERLRSSRVSRVRWRLYLPRVCAGAVLAAAIGLIAYMFASPEFYVWGAELEGARWVQVSDVMQAAGLEGMSIFYVDPGEAARRLEAMPQIARAEVTCDLPARVRVVVEERKPAAIWQNSGVQYWVDEEGVLFPRGGELADPLIIVEQGGPARAAGDRVEERVVRAAGRLAELIPGVRVIGFSPAEGLFFDIPQGYRVLTRPERDMEEVAAALQSLLEKLSREGIAARVLDLRYASRAYWR